ncbi:MAG: beta-1,6-N-acetylglucosaminyltransferase [Solobacterium sp.]|nr:beta-1,6-N-acetylglucosaminyltransferase [Solobacterium sp.]
MKIAYIVICHKDPELLGRLAETLYFGEDHLYVHVDRKSEIGPFQNACRNSRHVTFIEDRVDNYWGGWNSIRATMNALICARDNGPYDRYVLLQGQDYPLHCPQTIHAFFEAHEHEEFCKGLDMTHADDKDDYMKICGYYLYDYNKNNLFLKACSYALILFNSRGIRYRPAVFRNHGQEWIIYHGWAQWSLSDQAVSHVLQTYRENTAYNKFIRHRFPPDELYFPTIIYNSPFKEKVSDYTVISREGKQTILNLTYFEYPSTVVEFRDPALLQELLDTKTLFVRKVSSEHSAALLDAIDESIGRELREKRYCL